MKEKIHYLDGLRGLAALIVLNAHYVDSFCENNHYESTIQKTPLNLFYNGNFSVCMFFILSGYVLSYSFFNTKNSDVVIVSAVKRYFRLLGPVLASVIVAYLLLKLDLFSNIEFCKKTGSTWLVGYYNFVPNFLDALKQGLYKAFLYEEYSYNPILWTMHLELLGSFFTFAFLVLFGKLKKRYLIYTTLILIFLNTYYLAFLLGILLCDLKVNVFPYIKYTNSKIVLFVLLLVSLFFSSYPKIDVQNTIYGPLEISRVVINSRLFYHIIGSFLLVYVLLCSQLLQKLFSNPLMKFLGRISFSLYAIHLIIICSFSSSLYIYLLSHFSYKISFFISYIVSVSFTFLIAHASYFLFDKQSIKLGNRVYSFIDSENKFLKIK